MTDPIGVSPKLGRKRHTRDVEWLRARVEIDPQTGCWNWTGVVNHRGYGRYHYTTDSRVINGSAHRLALELALGRPLVEGMNACHTCDNPPCCNAEHLFEGTTDDNQQDCRDKGRAYWRAGEKHGMAKLSAADIPLIHAALAAGGSNRAVGQQFDVSATTISRIRTGDAWLNPEGLDQKPTLM